MTKPFAANRRIIAVELSNLLRIRRTITRMSRELEAGLPPGEMIATGGGRQIPRQMLLAYARIAFSNGLRNVCLARKALFKLSNQEPVCTEGMDRRK